MYIFFFEFYTVASFVETDGSFLLSLGAGVAGLGARCYRANMVGLIIFLDSDLYKSFGF